MKLRIEGVTSAHGRVRALHGIDLAVADRRITALIGPNGAGKTTLLRAISGIQPVGAGRIEFAGRDITRLRPAARVHLGLVQVPEGRQVFQPLSVEDNLRLGGHVRPGAAVAAGIERIFGLFPILRERRRAAAGSLSGGEQQMLAIGRALMAEPDLLLLDEPSLGLAPMMTTFIFAALRDLNACGLTILLVEQNAALALDLADDAYVLENGRVVLHGPARDLGRDEAVARAYLGT